ncbi:uncharacterized protein BDV14DRAFT_101203 [Aspergillus stella-maris]|uniref:uncharacterized protein n=1 Tax=Aspergillus stella-maris TaxID=1810926 RepID=UPI003CCD82ED
MGRAGTSRISQRLNHGSTARSMILYQITGRPFTTLQDIMPVGLYRLFVAQVEARKAARGPRGNQDACHLASRRSFGPCCLVLLLLLLRLSQGVSGLRTRCRAQIGCKER